MLVIALACRSHSDRVPARHDARSSDARAIDAPPPCPGKPELCAACEAGSAASCTQIAFDVPDHAKLPWYQRGCDGGDPTGCEGLAWAYTFVVSDPDKHDAAEARRLQLLAETEVKLRARCDARDEEACTDSGIDTFVGRGVAANPAEGTKILAASCDRSYGRACTALANLVDAVGEKAKWGRAACAAGEARTCGDLVGLFGDKAWAPGAWGFARDQLDRQCKARDAIACWVLAGLYWTRDRGKAAAALDAACAIDKTMCDDKSRLQHGEKFLRDVGPLPTLDLKPLEDELKKQK